MRLIVTILVTLAIAAAVSTAALADGRAGPGEFVEAPACSIDNIDEDCVYV